MFVDRVRPIPCRLRLSVGQLIHISDWKCRTVRSMVVVTDDLFAAACCG